MVYNQILISMQRCCIFFTSFKQNHVASLRKLSSDVHYKVGIMFPGQGAQHIGMGSKLANEIPSARLLYDCASSVMGIDLLKACAVGPKGG